MSVILLFPIFVPLKMSIIKFTKCWYNSLRSLVTSDSSSRFLSMLCFIKYPTIPPIIGSVIVSIVIIKLIFVISKYFVFKKVGRGGLEPPCSLSRIQISQPMVSMSYSMEFGTILPTRATPTTTLLILSTIVVKFWINIIVTNEENVTTPTKDIANSIVNVTFKLRLFCPTVGTIFSMNVCLFSLATNDRGYGLGRPAGGFPVAIATKEMRAQRLPKAH